MYEAVEVRADDVGAVVAGAGAVVVPVEVFETEAADATRRVHCLYPQSESVSRLTELSDADKGTHFARKEANRHSFKV